MEVEQIFIERKKIDSENKLELYSFQKIAVNHVNGCFESGERGSILSMSTGMGKTPVAITFLKTVQDELVKNSITVIIICPKSILAHWRLQLEKWGPLKCLVAVYSIESFRKAETPQDLGISSKQLGQKFVFVVDEAHLLKNPDSVFHQKLKQFQLFSQFNLLLTATPFVNNSNDIDSLCEFATKKSIFFLRWDSVKEITLPEINIQVISTPLNSRHKEIYESFHIGENQVLMTITDTLQRVAIHPLFVASKEWIRLYIRKIQESINNRKSKNQMLELFDSSDEDVETTKSEMDITYLLELTPKDIHSSLNIRSNLSDFCTLFNENQTIDISSKFAKALEIIQSNVKTDIVVVFSRFSEVLKLLQLYLSHHRITSKRIDGSVKSIRSRLRKIQPFLQRPEKCLKRVLLCSHRTCGFGWDFTFSSTVVLMENFWNKTIDEQVYARIHRIGQKKKCNVYIFESPNTVDVFVRSVAEGKETNKKMLYDECAKQTELLMIE